MRKSISLPCEALSLRTVSSFTVPHKGGFKTKFTTYPNKVKTQELISDVWDRHMQIMHVAIEHVVTWLQTCVGVSGVKWVIVWMLLMGPKEVT
ncbi:hypothetical protein AVEN_119660-1 [Araneus ventricosus]|uniref:Uncharacterized protein n=1 Tax=Araneus ventricosus TaxID=182803 RepID=A0A4Y2DCZ8_ARAVE|nr:hypothetical protein AVEN_193411-1 [Araneus ventricosus]GBM14600.1 hypothetical protein AVEN_30958-1 [Araneus ventricosus]GBM14619.1 hypothetical protein AVEN_93644-1 [Araneus ventricosus]GBM14623.1 hypothetical protein AVEN_119660-1 [Araneus ventricosus]